VAEGEDDPARGSQRPTAADGKAVSTLPKEAEANPSILVGVELGEVIAVPGLGVDNRGEMEAEVQHRAGQDPLVQAMGSLSVDPAGPSLSMPDDIITVDFDKRPSEHTASASLQQPADTSVSPSSPVPAAADGMSAIASTPVDADGPPKPNPYRRRKGKKKGKPTPPGFYFNVTEILRRLGLGDFEGRPHS
jgi:hypothetical protein